MRAELRRIHSPDVDDLSTWTPEGGEPAVLLQLMVGPEGAPGEESFDVTLCTAGWLGEQATTDGLFDARHHVVFARYDYDELRQYFRKRVAACQAETWLEVAAQVGRLGHWEFEDYRE